MGQGKGYFIVTWSDKPAYHPKSLKLHHFIAAQNRIRAYIEPTPLRYSLDLSRLSGAEVWLKLETLQPTGSFKVRGALYKLLKLLDQGRLQPLVTASAGNHGLGVAFAAAALKVEPVTIFIPHTTPRTKVDKLRQFPVSLHQEGQTYGEAHRAAERFAAQSGALYLSAYDDVEVVLGQGTCGLEILLDLPQPDLIITPTGGGGLLSGVALVTKAINPLTKVIGVQPQASPAAKLSLERKQPLDPYEHQPTIADGLAGGFGAIPFYLAGALIEDILLYSEAAIREAVFTLLDREKLVVEPSGAIAIAPLLPASQPLAGQTVVCILTGANVDNHLLSEILRHYL